MVYLKAVLRDLGHYARFSMRHLKTISLVDALHYTHRYPTRLEHILPVDERVPRTWSCQQIEQTTIARVPNTTAESRRTNRKLGELCGDSEDVQQQKLTQQLPTKGFGNYGFILT